MSSNDDNDDNDDDAMELREQWGFEPEDGKSDFSAVIGWTKDAEHWLDKHTDYLDGGGSWGIHDGGGIPVFGIRATRCLSRDGSDFVCTLDGGTGDVDGAEVLAMLELLKQAVFDSFTRPRGSHYEDD